MRFVAVLTALTLFISLPAHAEPLKVVASFSILGDLVKQVGGDKVDVETLVGPDGDAHVFQPTPADGKKVANAAIVFVNGLGFEGWMERLTASADYKGKLVTVSSGMRKPLSMDEDGKTITDPHAWQDVGNARLYIHNIAAALAGADKPNTSYYYTRTAAMDRELVALDSWVNDEIAKIPASKRKVITSHDAFGYFAKAYGVTFTAPVGISTEAEPSAKDMKQLIQQLKAEGVKAIFFENMASEKVVKQLASEAGVTVGPALYADALSPKDGPAPTYQEMFKYNVSKLVEGMKQNN